jgi:hypothetical protein
MADLAIIIAKNDPGLDAVAHQANCTIIESTRQGFNSLSTFDDHLLGNIGTISVGTSGFFALATFNS